MKHAAHILLIILISLSGLDASAQTPRTITLAVSDTIVLQPVRIIYLIEAGSQQKFMGMKFPSDDETDPARAISLDDLHSRLKKEKFNVTWSEGNGYDLSKEASIYRALEVGLTERGELERLVQILRPLEGISGSIKKIDHEPFANHQRTFYVDLVRKAREEASAIADATGLKLGEIISVTEAPSTGDTYMQMMGEMMKNPAFKSMMGGQEEVTKSYVRQLLVQFAVE